MHRQNNYHTSIETNVYSYTGHSTALHIAIEKGFRQIASLLLGHGANFNFQDKQGRTPLHLARTLNIVKLLYKYNIDPILRNDKNQTALEQYEECVSKKDYDVMLVEFMRQKEDEALLRLARQRLENVNLSNEEKLKRKAMIISANTTISSNENNNNVYNNANRNRNGISPVKIK
jgi:ankyrin repeat protein